MSNIRIDKAMISSELEKVKKYIEQFPVDESSGIPEDISHMFESLGEEFYFIITRDMGYGRPDDVEYKNEILYIHPETFKLAREVDDWDDFATFLLDTCHTIGTKLNLGEFSDNWGDGGLYSCSFNGVEGDEDYHYYRVEFRIEGDFEKQLTKSETEVLDPTFKN